MQEVSDTETLERQIVLTRQDRGNQVQWLKNLAQIDERRLYSLAGYESLWSYVQTKLGYAEGTVGKRIQVMRTAKTFPVIYEMLGACRVSSTVVSRLSRHLTGENHEALLNKAAGMSVRQVEEFIASLAPKPDVVDAIRKVAVTAKPVEQTELSMAPAPAEKRKEQIKPLAEARYHVNFTVGKDTRTKQERLDKVTHQKYTLEEIHQAGLDALLKKHDPNPNLKKPRAAQGPKKHTSYIPRGIQRTVATRDQNQCTYIAPDGHRCDATTNLHYDHIRPWGMGGSSHDPDNVRLLCASHNLWMAMQSYGKNKIQSHFAKAPFEKHLVPTLRQPS